MEKPRHLFLGVTHAWRPLSSRKKEILKLFKKYDIKEINLEHFSQEQKRFFQEEFQRIANKGYMKKSSVFKLFKEQKNMWEKEARKTTDPIKRAKMFLKIGEIEYDLNTLKFLEKIRLPVTLEPVWKKPREDLTGLAHVGLRDKATVEYLSKKEHPVAVIRGEFHANSIGQISKKLGVNLDIHRIEKPERIIRKAFPQGFPPLTPEIPHAGVLEGVKTALNEPVPKRIIKNTLLVEKRLKLDEKTGIVAGVLFEEYPVLRRHPSLCFGLSSIIARSPKVTLLYHGKKELFLKEVEKIVTKVLSRLQENQ